MVFHRRRIKINDINVFMQQNIIVRVNYTKILELIIDDQLKWPEHFQRMLVVAEKVLEKKYFANSKVCWYFI